MAVFMSARSFREYRLMFDIGPQHRGSVVADIGAGAASFCADWVDKGWGSCVAVDPAYSLPQDELRAKVLKGVMTTSRNIEASPKAYRWDLIFRSPADHRQERTHAAERFWEDISEGDHYVAGTATGVPLASASVDLVLSSHLLFTHAATLPVDFHLRAVREMIRIARKEVRVFPVVGFECDATSVLSAVREAAVEVPGVSVSVRRSRYEFLKGAHSMLLITK